MPLKWSFIFDEKVFARADVQGSVFETYADAGFSGISGPRGGSGAFYRFSHSHGIADPGGSAAGISAESRDKNTFVTY